MMELNYVKEIDWVSTDKQLADCLTKKSSLNKADWLLNVANENQI